MPSTSATSPRYGGVLVARELALDHARALLGADVDDAAVLEPHLEALHDLAGEHERLRRAGGSLRPPAVGRGEDLLGRHVRDVGDAVGGLRLAALPARLGQQPDRQVGARGRGSAASRSACRSAASRARPSFSTCARQAATGSSSSSRTQNSTSSHSASTSGSPNSCVAQPSFGTPATTQLLRPLVRLARELFAELRHPRLADAIAGQVGEQLRLRVAGQRDDRGVLVAEVLRPLEEPRRRPREHVVRGVLDQRPADVLVRVADVDVRRARAVRRRAPPRARRGRARSARSPRRAGRAGRSRRPGRSARRSGRPGLASVQLPNVLAQDRDGPAVLRDPVDGELRPADHEVRVDAEMFMPSPGSPSNTSGTPKP